MNRTERRLIFTYFLVLIFCAPVLFAPPLHGQSNEPTFQGQSPRSSRPLRTKPRAPTSSLGDENNELILPQVAPEILGDWGGHLYILSSDGIFRPSRSSPISLLFGRHSDGTIYVRTGVWGSSTSRLIRVTAQVVDPKKIKIIEEHFVTVGFETWRVTEKNTLILKNRNVMDCLESVQIYDEQIDSQAGMYSRPSFSAILHGSLHIISDDEESELHAELLRQGAVPQASVEGSNNFDR
jgi:hypothetical protein